MSTRKLAKELGLLRQRSKSSNAEKALLSNQIFSYLIVIDFESTCWREKSNYSQEIIEFPAVLLNTSTGEIQSEFHTYVQPQEHPILSEFCTELTGITQMQVEAGIPLQMCLSRFGRWLQKLQLEMGILFPNARQRPAAPSAAEKLCAFVTWSDWDLGVCLQYECKRKQLHKPDALNSWIDLRSTYRLFYDRKPKGLNGALQDLGIQFSGREHSGLDDSRNTAQLAARMMRDGCVMKITRSLEKKPALTAKPTSGITTAGDKNVKTDPEKTKPSSSKTPDDVSRDSDTKQNSVLTCRSLISPKTLLNGTAVTPLWGNGSGRKSGVSLPVVITHQPSALTNSSVVLCSTTLGCLSNATVEEESDEISVETEERRGSYDDVVLDGDDQMGETEGDFDYVSEFDSERLVWEDPEVAFRETTNVDFQTPRINNESSTINETRPPITELSACFAVPKSNRHITSRQIQGNSLFKHNSFLPGNTSTPHTSFIAPQHTKTPKCHVWGDPDHVALRENISIENDVKMPKIINESSMKGKIKSSNNVSNQVNKTKPSILEISDGFAVPKSNRHITSRQVQGNSLFKHNSFIPGNTSTPHTSFVAPQHTKTPKCHVWEDPDKVGFRENTSIENDSKMPKIINESSTTGKIRSSINVSNQINKTKPSILEISDGFAVPKSNRHISSRQVQRNTLFRHNSFLPGKTSTPHTSFVTPQHKKSSFTIFRDSETPSCSSLWSSKTVLSSLSTNTPSTRTGQRITSPLCSCGRRAKRQVVSNGGPNQGRGFFSCPVRRSGVSGGPVQKGCDFFKWESALVRKNSAVAAGASVSLCQRKSTLIGRPTPRKSY